MFVTRWHPDRPRTCIAEKDFVLGRILNSTFVIFPLPFVWLPLQSDMGLLGQACLLGWATGPINLTLVTLVTDRPPQYIYNLVLKKYYYYIRRLFVIMWWWQWQL